MAKTLSVVFRFEIGDLVQPKTASAAMPYLPTAGYSNRMKPVRNFAMPVMVTSRLAEECPGGVQLHYRVRGDFGTLTDVLECEVDPWIAPLPQEDK